MPCAQNSPEASTPSVDSATTAAAAPAADAGAAGPRTETAQVAPSADASAAAASFDPSKPRHLLQGVVTGPNGKPVANAVVYLEDAPVEETRGRSAMLGQKNMQFLSFVTVIAKGGKVIFSNDDPFPHNVNAAKPDRFDLGMMSPHSQRGRAFDKPGAYQLLCTLHPNMLAYIYVAPGSYFATTNGQGKYAIKDVPEGTHMVGAWAPGLLVDPLPATVGGDNATLDVTMHKPDTK
jgi:plastocyanin